jgi:hypothetical protein
MTGGCLTNKRNWWAMVWSRNERGRNMLEVYTIAGM